METPTEPRWLDEDEQATWQAVVGMLFKVPATLDAQLERDAGISHFEYLVLSWLSMSEERTRRMSDLAEVTNGSLSRLSHVARRLEKQGWLTRRPDPTDGRYTLATLTDAGWDKVVASAPGHVEAVRRAVIDPLTKAQAQQLRAIGTRIQHAIDADGSKRA